jgi:hypothetical protein
MEKLPPAIREVIETLGIPMSPMAPAQAVVLGTILGLGDRKAKTDASVPKNQ